MSKISDYFDPPILKEIYEKVIAVLDKESDERMRLKKELDDIINKTGKPFNDFEIGLVSTAQILKTFIETDDICNDMCFLRRDKIVALIEST